LDLKKKIKKGGSGKFSPTRFVPWFVTGRIGFVLWRRDGSTRLDPPLNGAGTGWPATRAVRLRRVAQYGAGRVDAGW